MEKLLFLDCEDICRIHERSIEKFGGSFGVRSQELLESAASMPMSGFGDTLFHETIYEMAAAYMFHLIKNHPFVDGNKRTALATMEVFLGINGYKVEVSHEELYQFTIDVATGMFPSKKEIAAYIETHIRRFELTEAA